MEFSISGRNTEGQWEIHRAGTATEAGLVADNLHERGIFPVHIKLNGKLLEDSDAFEAMIASEKTD